MSKKNNKREKNQFLTVTVRISTRALAMAMVAGAIALGAATAGGGASQLPTATSEQFHGFPAAITSKHLSTLPSHGQVGRD